jgi:mono/diheme cytochrome c family protein
LIVSLTAIAVLAIAFLFTSIEKPVDYSSQIKPILNKNCITCHGGVRKKGGFSLLFRDEALDTLESGKFAIVPGDPEKSEMIRRINLHDPDERMPYKHEPLSQEEIGLLTTWISQGAKWGEHWAYVSVAEAPAPDIDDIWVHNDIDRFILNKLSKESIEPSPIADASTLLRRVSLDLTGVPPETSLADSYLKDPTLKNYEQLVDSLLASPSFGERWTSMWMDLSRYADSKGYEKDTYRNIWKYRDWLIQAFNKDLPYDRFLTEQLAGDLLPDPTDDLLIATAFHRNTMTNDEGGTDSEEFRTAAVLDRVNTTWEALMGTTFACVQCHSHPYDPFKHNEYYKFMAFFNNTRDEDTNGDYPLLRQYQGQDSIQFLKLREWLEANVPMEKAKEQLTFLKTGQPAYNTFYCEPVGNAVVTESGLLLKKDGAGILHHVDLTGKSRLIFNFYTPLAGGVLTFRLDNELGKVIAVVPIPTSKDWQTVEKQLNSTEGYHDIYYQYTNPKLKDLDESGMYFDWLYFDGSFPGENKPGYDQARKRSWELLTKGKATTTPVMMENPVNMSRSSHVFERGNWMVKGEEVEPNVPHILNPMPDKAPKNRLGLAQWMTDKKNPLVARTLVNRLWEQLFGYGIAETVEDLGTQGIPPTDLPLLDHLAWKFMTDYKWSIKRLLKEMVMSSTYRQDSKTSSVLLEKDPDNRLYARGPRVRLTAEQLRDQGLFISGLLSKKMYGPGVKPFQPKGIWHSPYSDEVWAQSKGEDQYRRALYTHWKRTAPYPSMLTFDGAAREVCTSRRIRTNTPLQALVTLNDSAYFEMAVHFAKKMNEFPGKTSDKISEAYKQMMYKPISAERLAALTKLYDISVKTYDSTGRGTFAFVDSDDKQQRAQRSALVVVANALMNMDEWITKN